MANVVKILTATDLHRVKPLYDELLSVVESHKPDVVALVGDFLDAIGTASEQYSTAEAAIRLSQLPTTEIVFVRGNHEDFDWWNFADAWSQTGRKLNALHGEVFLNGPLAILGFPCAMGDETAFLGTREPLEDSEAWLSKLLRSHGPAMRTLWLMHEPPIGTPLSQKAGPLSGNPQWNAAIERFSPWLTISGHDHKSPLANKRWHFRIGQTLCINAGQSDGGNLHYCVINAEFGKTTRSLPSSMQVTAYPWNQSITLPLRAEKSLTFIYVAPPSAVSNSCSSAATDNSGSCIRTGRVVLRDARGGHPSLAAPGRDTGCFYAR